jgi:hypothetical protein
VHVEHARRLAADRQQRQRTVAVVGERAPEAGELRAQVVEDARADPPRRIAGIERDQRGEVAEDGVTQRRRPAPRRPAR